MSRTADPSRTLGHHHGRQQCRSNPRQEMQTFSHGAQLHHRADVPRPDRGSQDIRQTEQRGPVHEPLRSSAFRTMAHKILGQQPPPIETPLPPGRESIAHRYGYIVSTAQQKKASTRRARQIYRRQELSNAPPAVPHSSI